MLYPRAMIQVVSKTVNPQQKIVYAIQLNGYKSSVFIKDTFETGESGDNDLIFHSSKVVAETLADYALICEAVSTELTSNIKYAMKFQKYSQLKSFCIKYKIRNYIIKTTKPDRKPRQTSSIQKFSTEKIPHFNI